jgi:hypothetical protein
MGTFDVVASCLADMEEVGFSVAAVTGDLTGCDWAYTVGLHRSYGHPELVLVGLPAPMAGGLLQILGERVAEGGVVGAGDEFRVGPLRFRAVQVDDVFLAHGDWFNLGREVMADLGLRWPPTLQVLWADDSGTFPDEVAEEEWILRQPVLARRVR